MEIDNKIKFLLSLSTKIGTGVFGEAVLHAKNILESEKLQITNNEYKTLLLNLAMSFVTTAIENMHDVDKEAHMNFVRVLTDGLYFCFDREHKNTH